MSTEIYYFSGTGNSLFLAETLAGRLPGSHLIPIVSLLRQKVIVSGADCIGLVFPVHAIGLPIAVKQFLRKLKTGPGVYLFAVANRHGSIFRGFEQISQLLGRKKPGLNARLIVNMPMNDPRDASYQPPSRALQQQMQSQALSRIEQAATVILARQDYCQPDTEYTVDFGKPGFRALLLEKLVLFLMGLCEKTGGVNYFRYDQGCSGCGVCAQVCLSGKIRMDHGRPVWQKKVMCYMCYACVNYCPSRAVQIDSIPFVPSHTELSGRYHHPGAGAARIAAQKTEGRHGAKL